MWSGRVFALQILQKLYYRVILLFILNPNEHLGPLPGLLNQLIEFAFSEYIMIRSQFVVGHLCIADGHRPSPALAQSPADDRRSPKFKREPVPAKPGTAAETAPRKKPPTSKRSLTKRQKVQ